MKDGTDESQGTGDESAEESVRARREFLAKCGKYALVVPPAMVLLLSRTPDAKAACFGGSPGQCDS